MGRRIRKAVYWQDAPIVREQIVLIPTTLDDRIPEDHPVRLVDSLLSKLDWSLWESYYHGAIGQPPIHPSILCKVWIFALMRRIRSSRQVEYALKHSIDFIWLSSGREIDHATLSNFRKKHSEALKKVFRDLVKVAIDLNVANLNELCIDGTRVLANANKNKTWTVERISQVLGILELQLADELAQIERNDSADTTLVDEKGHSETLSKRVQELKDKRDALARELKTLEEMEKAKVRNGKRCQANPAQIPKTDTDSRILPNKEGGYAPNYTPMVATETSNGFIVSAQVEIGNVEHTKLHSIVEAVEKDFDAKVTQVLVDSAYTTGENLKQASDKNLVIVGPIAGVANDDHPAKRDDLSKGLSREDAQKLPMSPQNKQFDRLAFIYDAANDLFYCPAGKQVNFRCTSNHRSASGVRQRRVYVCKDCHGCPLADLCRKNPNAKKGREVFRDIYELYREKQREAMRTEVFQEGNRRRSHYGETQFAIMKHVIGIRRFLLRGIKGVTQEWLWGATAFNLRKLIGIISKHRSLEAFNKG